MAEKLEAFQVSKGLSNDVGAVVFNCPNCNETKIIRTSNDRRIAKKYKCAKCGFEGPN